MKKNIVNVSPWLLGAACALLALIIAVFAVTNYKREKVLMQEALMRQADVVVRVVSSSMRKSLFDAIRNRDQSPDFLFFTQRAVEQAQEQDGVDSVFIVDKRGRILAGSSNNTFENSLDEGDKKFIHRLLEGDFQQFLSRSIKNRDGKGEIFQFGIVLKDELLKNRGGIQRVQRMNMEQHSLRPNNRVERFSNRLEELIGDKSLALLITLDSERFSSGMQKQKQQLIVLSIILLLVGSGGWLSLLTLQGLRGSQARLAQLSAFNDRLVSTIPVGIIGVGQDGLIKIVNDKALNILNITEDKLLFKNYKVAIPELSDVVESSLLSENSKEVKEADGTIVQLFASNIRSESNDDEGFVIVLQDLTEQRNLEEELQRIARLASLGKVAAGVAHELRNPLSSIKGLGKLLQTRFEKDSHDRQTADVLVTEIDRLNRSISELLDYAKPQELELEEVDLVQCISKAVQLVKYDADPLGIDINTPEMDAITVLGNVDKLNQVFLNIFLNAIQAIDHKNGLISVSYEVLEDLVLVTISDNGVGLEEAIHNKVFDPYFTTKSEGTGLGLSMCSKIIEEHGGDIKISGKKDQGCSVSVKLPLS